jgi:hypothetical protein
MNNGNFSGTQISRHADAPPPKSLLALSPSALVFTPCPDEVSRRAYFAYVNEGSPPGRDVQHWLTAEAELIAERNRTRIHAYHNAT